MVHGLKRAGGRCTARLTLARQSRRHRVECNNNKGLQNKGSFSNNSLVSFSLNPTV